MPAASLSVYHLPHKGLQGYRSEWRPPQPSGNGKGNGKKKKQPAEPVETGSASQPPSLTQTALESSFDVSKTGATLNLFPPAPYQAGRQPTMLSSVGWV